MNPKLKSKTEELMRLAFIYAEDHQRSFADGCDPDSPEAKRAAREADQFRKYRIRRWGLEERDRILNSVKPLAWWSIAYGLKKGSV